MRQRFALALLIGCMTAVAAPAQVDRPQCGAKPVAKFCQGYYSLCIKALCRHVPGSATEVDCACSVQQGWSMGPADCSVIGRNQQTKPAPGGPLMSTYSNQFNPNNRTLTCTSGNTEWAWCYGAPCKVDGPNGATATCRCPVCTGKMSTLGGECNTASCSKVWSAATPANDIFANQLFYDHLKKQGVDVPPPAEPCHPTAGH